MDICGIHLINIRVTTFPWGLSYFKLLCVNIHISDTCLSHNTLAAVAFKRVIADNYCLGKEWLKIEELNAKMVGVVLDLGC